jgi:hypothetical protein
MRRQSLVVRRRTHHWIVAAVCERMAAQQPPQRHHSSTQGAITLDGLHGVFRTCRNIAACGREHRRDGPLVGSQQLEDNALCDVAHKNLSALRLSACGTRKLLPYYYERLPDFVQHCIEVGREKRLLRVDDDVRGWSRYRPRQAYCLSQSALHAITLNCSTKGPSDCKSHAKARNNFYIRLRFLPRQVKHGHRCRKMPLSLLINTLEISMAQQARATRKRLGSWPLYTSIRCFGHTGGHRASDSALTHGPDRVRSALNFSRKNYSRTLLATSCFLFAKTWFHRDPLAPLGAAAG